MLLKGFEMPMVSDRSTLMSRYFGILNENSWNSERWTFIISPESILKTVEVHTEPVGRSSNELIRKLKALKFVTENKWQACPASWNTDMPVLKPSIKIAWKVGENM
jgi:peroxiredoxin (alkyl hydroperoxide reductase subunit C)